jgi:16S RNA G1207 methylase RsmC
MVFSARGFDTQTWIAGGVFSASRLDPGTEQLLRTVPDLPNSGNFLDLGCGWGPVALTIAQESPRAKVWAVDVNPRAVALTKDGAETNDLRNITALLASEALSKFASDGTRFDVILSNPPVRIGKEAMHQMLDSWLPLLAPDGTAWLVMSKNLGGDSLVKWLQEREYDTKKFASRKGFRIIKVQRP